jgi:hypothetical protein
MSSVIRRKVLPVKFDPAELTPVSDALGDSKADSAKLLSMAADAKHFIESFDWCNAVEQQYFGMGVGGVVAVFLCKITPAKPKVDDWLWVVVGDVPSAYLVTDDAPTPTLALEAYVREMSDWVAAAKNGRDVKDLIPVNVPATPEWGAELERRLAFIEQKLLGGANNE